MPSVQTHHHCAYATRKILNLDVPLATFPSGKLAVGNYEFPFHATIPAGLPSSMSLTGSSWAKICYEVTARLTRPGKTFMGFQKDDAVGTNTWNHTSGNRFSATPSPAFVEPDTKKVNYCGCFNYGQMTLSASLANTNIGRGGGVDYGVACFNESSIPITEVSRRRVHSPPCSSPNRFS